MNRTLLIVACLALACGFAPSAAEADEGYPVMLQLQEENVVMGGEVMPGLNGLGLAPLNIPRHEYMAVFGNLFVSGPYSNAYVGPAFIITPEFIYGIGFGVGQSPTDPHGEVMMGNIARLDLGTFKALGYFEYVNLDNFWYDVSAMFWGAPWLGGGVMVRDDGGVGPRLELEKLPVTLYGALLYEWKTGSSVGLIGVRFSP